MTGYVWILEDAAGGTMRTTETFDSQSTAEEWMGERWSDLLAEGAERVVLSCDGKTLYRMGLRAE